MPELLNRLRYEIRQYRRGLPTVASFDITERCELHCKMCRFWIDGNHEEALELRTVEICALIDELVDDLGVRRVRLLGGEPFLRPDALDIVRHAKERGVHVNVVTEGSHVDEARAEEIVRSGLDSIRFSIDGIGRTHDVVRGRPGAFDEVTGAVRRVQSAKRRIGSRTPEVQIFSVISSLNYDQILPLDEACRTDLAPARFLFGPIWEATPEEVGASVWEGRQLADRHHLPLGKSLRLDGDQSRVFRRQVGQIRQSRKRSGLPQPIARLVSRSVAPRLSNLGARVARALLSRPICPETNSFHLDPFGRVKVCSVYMNYAFGKYPESSVREIWFSRNHRAFHLDLKEGGFLPLCRTVCGRPDDYYVGTPRQLARNLLLRMVPSPYRDRHRGAELFAGSPPDLVIDPEPLAAGTHPWIRRKPSSGTIRAGDESGIRTATKAPPTAPLAPTAQPVRASMPRARSREARKAAASQPPPSH